MSTMYKGEAFYTSEELDIRLSSYINKTADDLVMNLRKRKNKKEVTV